MAGSTAPRQASDHKGDQSLLTVAEYSWFAVLCVGCVFWILCFVSSDAIVSARCSSVSPASGEKRKAITLELKFKIIAPTVGSRQCSAHV